MVVKKKITIWELRSSRCTNGSHMACKAEWCMCACHFITERRIAKAKEHLKKMGDRGCIQKSN